jgi:hypothetical protein
MAAATWKLVNQTIEQPEPRIVPRPNALQAVALQDKVQRIKVQLRGRETRPKNILLGTVNHGDFRVVKAIPVNLDVRGTTVIAQWREIDEFGTGKSSSLACDDLGHTIAELYASLKAELPRLGPDLERVWRVLTEHVVERRPHEISRV